MGFLNYIEEQKKLGNLSNKEALDMKMNYMTLSQKEKSELDSQYSNEKEIKKIDSNEKEKEIKLAEKRDNELEENPKKYRDALLNLVSEVNKKKYEDIFEIYTIFKKNKFIESDELKSMVKKTSELQWRSDYENFYKEWLNGKVSKNKNYIDELDKEFKDKLNSKSTVANHNKSEKNEAINYWCHWTDW